MKVLIELPVDTLVGVVAVDARRRRLLEAIVQQYSVAAVRGVLLDDLDGATGLVEAADVVVVTNAAELPEHLVARVRRLLRVSWALEPGSLGSWPVGGSDRPRHEVDLRSTCDDRPRPGQCYGAGPSVWVRWVVCVAAVPAIPAESAARPAGQRVGYLISLRTRPGRPG
jgi:hypothetical protein